MTGEKGEGQVRSTRWREMEEGQGRWKGIGERESEMYRGEGHGRGTGEMERD